MYIMYNYYIFFVLFNGTLCVSYSDLIIQGMIVVFLFSIIITTLQFILFFFGNAVDPILFVSCWQEFYRLRTFYVLQPHHYDH